MTQYALTMLFGWDRYSIACRSERGTWQVYRVTSNCCRYPVPCGAQHQSCRYGRNGNRRVQPIALCPQTSIFSGCFRCVLCADHNLHRPTFRGRKRCLFRLAGTIDQRGCNRPLWPFWRASLTSWVGARFRHRLDGCGCLADPTRIGQPIVRKLGRV